MNLKSNVLKTSVQHNHSFARSVGRRTCGNGTEAKTMLGLDRKATRYRLSTVDGGPRGPNFIKILVFGGFEGSGGAGGITNRRGMKKYPGGLIFVRFGWSYEGFMPIIDFG